ncbi:MULTISPECIES: hypothetical protein [unclassified Microbacterium]|uniref:hypothetical protein n=1 Tax=unclassified Microbacterium TaxID=2609290 RepID=UPI003017026E
MLTKFDVDVAHVADSSLDVLLGTRDAKGFQRLLATLVFTRNLRRHRIALVRTVFGGTEPEAGHVAERVARRVLDRATRAFITLDDSIVTPNPSRTTRIPHASFSERYIGYPRSEQIEGRILCLSPGYLPSGTRQLLGVVRVTSTPGVTLRLAGRASRALEPHVRSAIARHASTVSARLEQLSDGAQVQEISAAELVAVPHSDSPEERQLVYLALSLDRPVITPRTPAMAALAREVGAGWVHLTDGPITAKDIDVALTAGRSGKRTSHPDLHGRDLRETTAAYAAVFRAASYDRLR